jgi:hypothetical protein
VSRAKWEDLAGYEDGEDPDEAGARHEGTRAKVHAHLLGRPAPRREVAVSNVEPVDRRSPDEQLADYTARYDRKSTKRR